MAAVTWAPYLGPAISGLVTAGALVLQSLLQDRRARRQKADDERRALDEKKSSRLLEARVDWANAYQIVYALFYTYSAASKQGARFSVENRHQLDGATDQLHQAANRLRLVEPRPSLRRMVRLLTHYNSAGQQDPNRDLKALEQVYRTFIEFIDALAEPDPEKSLSNVIQKLAVPLVEEVTEEELRVYVLTGDFPEGSEGRLALISPNAGQADQRE